MKYFLSLLVGFISFVSVSHALMAAPMRLGEPARAMPEGCLIWNDGCNDCGVEVNRLMCPPRNCATMRAGYCRVWENEGVSGIREEDYYPADPFEDPAEAPRAPLQPWEIEMPSIPPLIPLNCATWYDGCNTCGASNGELTFCTMRACEGPGQEAPYCMIFNEQKPNIPEVKPDIPLNCESWFDGCNNCGVDNGDLTFCTEMACAEYQEPHCTRYVGTEKRVPVPLPEPEVPANCETWFDGCNRCKVMSDGGLACTRMACANSEPSRCLAYREEAPDKPQTLVPSVTETMEVSIGAEMVPCNAFRQTCMMMDGEIFYDWIDGFDFEAGFNYRLKISKTKREQRLLDVGDYQYELLEMISKTPVGLVPAVPDDTAVRRKPVGKPIEFEIEIEVPDQPERPGDCLNWDEAERVCRGYGGDLSDEAEEPSLYGPMKPEIELSVWGMFKYYLSNLFK